MYSDTKQQSSRWLLLLLIALILIAAAAVFSLRPGRDISEESAGEIQAAVMRSARQCYAVEGIYPPSLQYLEDNYGLQVNRDDFYITYDAFASNMPPTVIVKTK